MLSVLKGDMVVWIDIGHMNAKGIPRLGPVKFFSQITAKESQFNPASNVARGANETLGALSDRGSFYSIDMLSVGPNKFKVVDKNLRIGDDEMPYNYLRGFGYNHDDLAVELLTDNGGRIKDASNVLIDNRHAKKGTGLATDIGVGAVVRRWEVGLGAKGIGNRIDWTGVKEKTLTLASVVGGNGNFAKSGTVAAPDVRVILPVDYRGNVAYNANRWSAVGEIGHGFGGGSFHGGMEWHANSRFELRGGSRYTLQKWNPTFGAGLNISRKVSFDVAAFGTNANVERKHQMAIAASIRFNHFKDKNEPKS